MFEDDNIQLALPRILSCLQITLNLLLDLTSVAANGLCPPEEAQVAGPGVGLAHVAAAHKPEDNSQ